MHVRKTYLAAAVALASCALQIGCETSPDLRPKVPNVKGDPAKVGKLSKVTRAECMRIADSYVHHHWKATAANVFHGVDADGIHVETPDVSFSAPGKAPGYWTTERENVSIPYCWGGMDTPESFDRALAEGKAAGDVCTDDKRRSLDDGVSKHTCGVDCSGLVSRCWKLDWPCSTREVPFVCDPLPDFAALKPGDVVNYENAHIMLFAGFRDAAHKEILIYQTGSPNSWAAQKSWVPIWWLKAAGYKPWRYKGMRD